VIELSPRERAALRARAHPLHAVVSIGQHGLTATVLHEIDVALNAHELVKIRVHLDDRAQRATMLEEVARALEAAPVQHLGKLLILWRPKPEAAATQAPASRATTRASKQRSSAKGPGAGRRPRAAGVQPPGITGRRARGAPLTRKQAVALGKFTGEPDAPTFAKPRSTAAGAKRGLGAAPPAGARRSGPSPKGLPPAGGSPAERRRRGYRGR